MRIQSSSTTSSQGAGLRIGCDVPGNRPTVTIVTPSLNQGGYLRECIESVLGQDYPHLEYIIMDGGSTDESVRIIRSYAERIAHWESHPDGGQSDAINGGWWRGAGDIVAWMNADDSYLPGAVTAAVQYLAEHPDVDIVYGDYNAVDENGSPSAGCVPARPFDEEALMRTNFIPSGSTFIRADVVRRVGFLDSDLKFVMDWDYWLRASTCCTFAFLARPLSNFRIHPAGRTWSDDGAKAKEIAYLASTLGARLHWRRSARLHSSLGAAGLYLVAASYSLTGGERRRALAYVLKSFANAPCRLGWTRLRVLAHVFGVRRNSRSQAASTTIGSPPL